MTFLFLFLLFFIYSFCIQMGHYAATIMNQIMGFEELNVAQEKNEKVDDSATEVKAKAIAVEFRIEATEAKVAQLEEALKEAEALIVKVETNLKKKWRNARSKATKLEKKMESQVAEAKRIMEDQVIEAKLEAAMAF
ncbi:hypothetical protein COCNU_scaffold002569G000010 [Cocos nucifera]|nr:hypothetical protein [Cocos nucifera]